MLLRPDKLYKEMCEHVRRQKMIEEEMSGDNSFSDDDEFYGL